MFNIEEVEALPAKMGTWINAILPSPAITSKLQVQKSQHSDLLKSG